MKKLTLRQQEKQRLIAQKQMLEIKYTPNIYNQLTEEPVDILQHTREVIKFRAASMKEEMDLQLNFQKIRGQ